MGINLTLVPQDNLVFSVLFTSEQASPKGPFVPSKEVLQPLVTLEETPELRLQRTINPWYDPGGRRSISEKRHRVSEIFSFWWLKHVYNVKRGGSKLFKVSFLLLGWFSKGKHGKLCIPLVLAALL